MRYLKTTEAAGLLKVGPTTLRAWEQRFGFPKPQRSPGGQRSYTYGEVAALREALRDGLSISSAVVRVRAELVVDRNVLVRALAAYDRQRADRAMETALGVYSMERAVEHVLLPSLDQIASRNGVESAAWALAARWANDWLRRATRLTPPPPSPISILLGDASRDELDLDRPYIRALELFCLRAGTKLLSLSARAVTGIGDAVSAHRPDILVVAGADVDDHTVARWAQAIERSAGPRPLRLYRRVRTSVPDTMLSPMPSQARSQLIELAGAAHNRAAIRPVVRHALAR